MNKTEFTIEYLLYGAVFLLAMGLRFIHLGQFSLNDYEAVQALQALKISSGSVVLMGDQPAYVILTAGLFRIFAATNFLARFWPALIGAGIVFLPLLFRKFLGDRWALLVGVFLAIDPALIAISSTASGESLAIVFGIAALGFFLHKKYIPAGIFLGAAIASGPVFWFGLLLLVLVSLIISVLLSPLDFGKLTVKEWDALGGSAVVTLVLLSTGFMTTPNGITGIANALVSFVNGWSIHSLTSVKTALLVFVVTYLPLLLLGGFGFGVSIGKQRSKAGFLGTWFLVSILMVVFNPSREIIDWVWAALPLWGLAAVGIEVAIQRVQEDERVVLWVEVGLTITLVIFSFLNILAYFFNSSPDLIVNRNRLIGAALPIGLLLVMTVFLAWGWSPRSAIRGLGFGIGILLFGWMISAALKNAGGILQPSAIAWKPQAITVGEAMLTSQIGDLSMWNHGIRNAIDIDVVGYDVPSMRWALRNFTNVAYDTQFSQVETPSIIIAPDYLQIGTSILYRGQGLSWSQYPTYSQMRLYDWVKWTIYRQAPVDQIRLILWARNDLFK